MPLLNVGAQAELALDLCAHEDIGLDVVRHTDDVKPAEVVKLLDAIKSLVPVLQKLFPSSGAHAAQR